MEDGLGEREGLRGKGGERGGGFLPLPHRFSFLLFPPSVAASLSTLPALDAVHIPQSLVNKPFSVSNAFTHTFTTLFLLYLFSFLFLTQSSLCSSPLLVLLLLSGRERRGWELCFVPFFCAVSPPTHTFCTEVCISYRWCC